MCDHEARFKLHLALGNDHEDYVPNFDTLPLDLTENITDVDPAKFMQLKTKPSNRIDHTLATRAREIGESWVNIPQDCPTDRFSRPRNQ